MRDQFQYIIPGRSPAPGIFASYQLTYEFRREAEYREELKRYGEWYRQTAQTHQQEVAKMRGDINILGWFNRHRK